VLSIAGNHDSELHVYVKAYARAWRDLDRWAAPLPIEGKHQPPGGLDLGAAPFTYSTTVDDVHLTLAHVVSERIAPAVMDFIAKDLSGAREAPLRLFFAHVPLVGVGNEPRKEFGVDFARVLEAGRVDLYVAGHEHLVWDEDVSLPGGGSLRQVVVGSASALWRFGPNRAARKRARCVREGDRMRCRMPHQGLPFDLRLVDQRWLQTQPHTFTLFTVDGHDVTTRVLAVDRHGTVTGFGSDTAVASNEPGATPGASP
jgi:hypothetical protein